MTKLQRSRGSDTARQRRALWKQGLIDGAPIYFGYFAVSFTFGIAAAKNGFGIFAPTLMSATSYASAGQFSALMLLSSGAGVWEMIATQAVVNSRYLLMSCAMSQRIKPSVSIPQRMLLALGLTDELFGMAISRPGWVEPSYSFGAMLLALPVWVAATFFGALLGSVLPLRVLSALGMALYGMLLAIIVPPAKKNRVVLGVVALSMLASYLFDLIPSFGKLGAGIKIIVLTLALTSAAAWLFPVKEGANE
ncbi:MAG: AzlC family ABC transporter permease [Ndongobacter sp.]|nr:AzlC family ABC transporter permease [Ndongobacter sp.]